MSSEWQPLLDGTNGRKDVIRELLCQEVEFERVVNLVRRNKEGWGVYRSLSNVNEVFKILDEICSLDFHTKHKIVNLSNVRILYDSEQLVHESLDVATLLKIYDITQKVKQGIFTAGGTKREMMYAEKFETCRCVYDLQLKCIEDARNILSFMNKGIIEE